MPFLGGATLAAVNAAAGRRRSGHDLLARLDRASAPEYPASDLPRPARELMLARLLLIEPQRDAGLRRPLGKLAQGPRGVLGVPVREDRDLSHGSTSRAIARSPPSWPAAPARLPAVATAAARPASPSQMNVSRLPFGPGSPEE